MGHGRQAPPSIELGNEPPLGLDGDVEEPIDRRRVSIRWLAATVLAAVAGGGLMGGAVYAALDGEYRFAQVPEFARQALRAAGDRISNASRKADRMSLLVDLSTARQTLRVSTTTRVADREIVRVRPFIRVASNLATSPTEFASSVPAFNPVKLMTEEDPRHDDGPAVEPTGELSIVMRDLLQVPAAARIAATLRNEDVIYSVRQALLSNEPELRPTFTAGIGIPVTSSALGYASENGGTGEINVLPNVAENLSSVPKTAAETTGGNTWSERTVIAKKGEGLSAILKELNAVPQATTALIAAFGSRGRDGGIVEGHRVRVLLDTMQDGQTHPLRVSIFSEKGHEATVALGDNGRYVSVEEPREMDVAGAGADESEEGPGIRLYQSIYETALRNEIPRPMIENIIRTFSFDVDLHRRVRPGDSFEVLYAGDESGGDDVLYAALVFGQESRRYYRFLTDDDGIIDYYDEAGKSAKKFLVRKPMSGGVFRSGFGPRKHPILGYTRMHTGVDWAESTGAPIFAAGNGTVLKAERDRGGYGLRVEIQHLNGYVTAYSHLSGFARGITGGTKVRQGQVIGYVGNTGLSTGPHLHYEVMINGNFVDPMRIRLPRGRELDGKFLRDFETERARIDSIIERGAAMPRVATN
ncbi:MAG TPA: M23 family metallopeptidase [Xanthobacteraceae bacterium]|nr:M23 family metallopeptidase [Xanthobacteraceae bacterium]